MVMLRGLVACALVLLTASCKRDTAPKAPAKERVALDRDIAARAQPFSAAADWKVGPFSVQVEDALRGKRLLLKGVSVDDLIRRDDGYHALLGSDETDAILEESNVPTNLRFLEACSEADASALVAKASEIASMDDSVHKILSRVSVIDGIVEASGVRGVSGF